ncbi:MAG: sigma-54 factor interaction domain-containing protein, partial [Candidatus Scalindua sediminis]
MDKSTEMEASDKALDIKGGLREEPELWKIIGSSKEIKDVFKNIQTVLESDIPVVIHGETGTGKELVAKALHYRGPRRKYPLRTMNCAAIPESLLESELLGHEKGAFTGATQQRIGKLELANNGSLFLDEISEMPLTIQSKILRVIEEQVFERVGGNSVIETNVRIISASNVDLLEEVR